jgi:hypothetical protein
MQSIKDLVIGAVANATFLTLSAIAYNLFLIRWAAWLFGACWFFPLEAIAIPCIFLIIGKTKMAIGSLFGIPLYYFGFFAVINFLGMSP